MVNNFVETCSNSRKCQCLIRNNPSNLFIVNIDQFSFPIDLNKFNYYFFCFFFFHLVYSFSGKNPREVDCIRVMWCFFDLNKSHQTLFYLISLIIHHFQIFSTFFIYNRSVAELLGRRAWDLEVPSSIPL